MNNLLAGILMTIFAYLFAIQIQKKTGLVFLHPLLTSSAMIIVLLMTLSIPFETYNQGAQFISAMVGPATVSLAIPLYKNMGFLKKHLKQIILGVSAGVLFHALVIMILAVLLSFEHEFLVTVLPQSVTTAIATELVENYGGFKEITILIVIVTGILGASFAPIIFKVFKIKDPLAQGVALGTASHAVGTSKAVELGEKQTSASSVALILSGILTVVLMPLFMLFTHLL